MLKKIIALAFFIANGLYLNAQSLQITNVNVIPIEGKENILQNQTVIIKDGKISDIIPFKQEQTNDKSTIDGTGKYLIPGLADMHVHFPDEKEMSLNEFFKLNLAAGVTTLRSMRGESRHLRLRDSIKKNLILAPDLYISTSLPSDSTVTASQLKTFVILSKADGWDFIKYLSGLSPALFDSAALYCKQSNIKLAGHVYGQDIETALKINQASVEHYQTLLKQYRKDSLHFGYFMNQLKEKNIFVCPTLSFYYIWGFQFTTDQLKDRNGMKQKSPQLFDTWLAGYNKFIKDIETRNKLSELEASKIKTQKNLSDFNRVLKLLAKYNVMVLLSPDESSFNVPGFAMAEEMKLYSRAGVSNYGILKIATSNAASFFDKQNEWGTISIGKKANLVLLDKNPLEEIENIKTVNTVILGGKAYKQEELLKK